MDSNEGKGVAGSLGWMDGWMDFALTHVIVDLPTMPRRTAGARPVSVALVLSTHYVPPNVPPRP